LAGVPVGKVHVELQGGAFGVGVGGEFEGEQTGRRFRGGSLVFVGVVSVMVLDDPGALVGGDDEAGGDVFPAGLVGRSTCLARATVSRNATAAAMFTKALLLTVVPVSAIPIASGIS
jgi:hypothetical protein